MRLKLLIIGLFFSLALSSCVPDNNSYYPDNGNVYRPNYDNNRYDSRYDYDRDRDRDRWERDRAREERERLERERERLEWEREQYHRPPPVVHQPRPESCQSGFYLRGSKCSDKERKRGCRDSRSSGGGQYCVSGV